MNYTEKSRLVDFVAGDMTGLSIPAHGEALLAQAEAFLTRAFHAFGVLEPDNRVKRLVHWEACPGGSTGHKLFLSVEYEKPDSQLHTELFVKFSRDFSNPLRDRGRYELEAEVRFAALSRSPDFPISVPAAYFADYHAASGTGILVTERIPFGSNGIEQHYQKCLDHQLSEPLPYYRAIVTALARLAATHKSGRLGPQVEAHFPFDPHAAVLSDRIPHSVEDLRRQISRYKAFALDYPQLVPPNIADPAFFAQLDAEVGRFLEHELLIKQFLQSNPDLIALCHWNANIDNAWFWRDSAGKVQCGLMDWGRVRQLNVAYALWGCLSGATAGFWNKHLDELLNLFVDQFHRNGGPLLNLEELELHLQLYAATMGIAWLLEAPDRILTHLPEAADASGPTDPVFLKHESARNQLHISSTFLNFWQTRHFGRSLDELLARDIPTIKPV